MTTLTSTDIAPLRRFRFTVDDYHRLAEVGILHEQSPVELIHGELICMAPIGRMHAGVTNELADWLHKLSPGVVVAVQNPVRLDQHNDPQPDVVLLKPRKDKYKGKTAAAEDVLLIIEVADTTFEFDYNVKRALYAANLIPEYWIIDIARKRVVVCRGPLGGVYREEQVLSGEDRLASVAFPDHSISVRQVVE